MLGELGAETTSKSLGYPQGLAEVENTGENITGYSGHGHGRQDYPHYTDYLKSNYFFPSREKSKVFPEPGEWWDIPLPMLGLVEHAAFLGYQYPR